MTLRAELWCFISSRWKKIFGKAKLSICSLLFVGSLFYFWYLIFCPFLCWGKTT